MKCRFDDCDRDAMYKSARLCQMHYFRIRRNGHPRKERILKKSRFITPKDAKKPTAKHDELRGIGHGQTTA